MAELKVSIDGAVATGGALPVSGSLVTTPSGTQNVSITSSPATVPVSGTVTTVPSGTQTVSGTVTTVPSGTQTVTGTVTATPTGTQVVSGTVNTISTVASGTNFYGTNISDTAGVVAANNFLSVFNPVGSGKTVTFYIVSVVPWATAASTTTVSMNLFRTTAASVGTLVTPHKFSTASPSSIAEVRTTNPTVTTTGIPVIGFPPAVTTAPGGASPTTNGALPLGVSFVCQAGEGVVLRTASGAVGQLWNLGFIWSEL